MKVCYLLLFVFLCSFKTNIPKLSPDKAEAQAAFELINKIRLNPSSFSETMGVDLNDVKQMPALVWNDTLAKVAEAKALDMANRNYFNHITLDGYGMNYYINKAGYTLRPSWLNDPKNNFFESIQAGATSGVESVKFLIVDKNVPSLGHRKHLLGMDEWNASLYDIGIGFVRTAEGSYFKSYTCVIIAKHK